MKRPSFQFYAADWFKDPALRASSLEARGLWIDLICLMHQAIPYGHLCVNGRAIQDDTLARMVGVSRTKIRRLLNELEENGVFSIGDDGIIYSRRMVRDEDVRSRRAEGGKLGGNPVLLDKKEVGEKVNLPPNLGPTPSSSSSASAGSSDQDPPLPPRDKQEQPPCWIDLEAWEAWCQHRREIRKPVTKTQAQQQWRKLATFREQGHDPTAVIEHCIANGWQGLFPPDRPGRSRNGRSENSHERVMRLNGGDRHVADDDPFASGGGDGALVDQDGNDLRR